MDQEIMLENSMSREGVWAVHIIRMGAPVEVEPWLTRVPAMDFSTLETRRWVESGLGMHHLHLVGNLQDVIEMRWPNGDKERAAFWWAKRLGMREAARQAAERFYIAEGMEAGEVVVRDTPPGAGKTLEVEALGKVLELRITAARWAPRGYVVVRSEAAARIRGGIWITQG
jgi:hypothetical protein